MQGANREGILRTTMSSRSRGLLRGEVIWSLRTGVLRLGLARLLLRKTSGVLVLGVSGSVAKVKLSDTLGLGRLAREASEPLGLSGRLLLEIGSEGLAVGVARGLVLGTGSGGLAVGVGGRLVLGTGSGGLPVGVAGWLLGIGSGGLRLGVGRWVSSGSRSGGGLQLRGRPGSDASSSSLVRPPRQSACIQH